MLLALILAKPDMALPVFNTLSATDFLQVDHCHRFVIGKQCFESLSELISELKSLQCGMETLRLGTAVFRTDDIGRFGAHCIVEELPREKMKTVIPLPDIKQKSVLVMLKSTIAHSGIDEELESLMLLKHSNLIGLKDFATYQNGPVILRYEMYDCTSLYDIMLKEDVISLATTLKWVQQVLMK
ncbi:unnamed protein product [Strongylus vulgaris]|uniref:Serine-threonine/tyrosine-protein kinase catalytic domain-containing protein n=1 Tax=Strongylus vulgaris TaxID=40348 RepID=A0A3P7ICB9_STRVU|nr:unnamed protein product [Strongylus vulgaris]